MERPTFKLDRKREEVKVLPSYEANFDTSRDQGDEIRRIESMKHSPFFKVKDEI